MWCGYEYQENLIISLFSNFNRKPFCMKTAGSKEIGRFFCWWIQWPGIKLKMEESHSHGWAGEELTGPIHRIWRGRGGWARVGLWNFNKFTPMEAPTYGSLKENFLGCWYDHVVHVQANNMRLIWIFYICLLQIATIMNKNKGNNSTTRTKVHFYFFI